MNDKKKILLVDDDDDLRKDLKDVLEMCGYLVESAENGKDGFEKVFKVDPDIIISDISMPVMDGYEFLNELKKDVHLGSIPFLFVTAKGQYSDLRKGMQLGADDYIYKPYELTDLLNTIETRLNKADNNTKDITLRFEGIINNIRKSIPHEIRTPLTGIISQAEWLLTKDKNEDFNNSLLEILSDAKRLNRLFENYIFLTNLELLKGEDLQNIKTQKTFLPNSIISDICNYKFENKGRKFNLILDDKPDEIKIHENHFTKMVYELVDNSVKFSDHDSIIQVQSQFDSNKFEFKITNNGKSLSPEQLKQIGTYVQFNRDLHEQQGLGLGLSIVKKVLDIYEGKLIVNNNDDLTTIGFSLNF